MIPINYFLTLSITLFSIGIYGALSKRNIILVLLSIELMLNSVNINFIAFSRYVTPKVMTGQLFVTFTMVVTACEIGVGLAIVLSLFRLSGNLNTDKYNQLKG
ncbi:MAG: NADH-quinone oxidoreductase subunit NuoK [Actinobacteria bacterium]|nr:MAG: NADH-quinone oxidoreductase subunit NuoK [Actinomycetota bacterium]